MFCLWPAADLVVLADMYPAYTRRMENGMIILNPGTFLLDELGFYVYYPAKKDVEASSAPLD